MLAQSPTVLFTKLTLDLKKVVSSAQHNSNQWDPPVTAVTVPYHFSSAVYSSSKISVFIARLKKLTF